MMTRKALIVDDSALVHRLHEIALDQYRGCDWVVVSATSGLEGLELLHRHPDVDLILLDVNMPNMNGLEFLEVVRREPAFAGAHVVLQSTEDRAADIERGLAAGATAYLTKPFTVEQVHDVLDALGFDEDIEQRASNVGIA